MLSNKNITIKNISVQEIIEKGILSYKVIGDNFNSLIDPSKEHIFYKILPYEELKGDILRLSAGVESTELKKYSNCFFSLETIPGTIGGLIYNNASCAKCISDYLLTVLYGVSDEFGSQLKIDRISKRECRFSKRSSLFRKLEERGKKVVILEATFKIPESYEPTEKEIEKMNIKLSQMKYFRDDYYENGIKFKKLIKNNPIGPKGCIYCDHDMSSMMREFKFNGTIRHNIKLDKRWGIYWIPTEQATYEDWCSLINELNILYYEKYNKMPFMEIEII